MIPNVVAFGALVAHGEGTDHAPDPYRVCYTFRHTIISFADHPAVTGEWLGERITVGVYAGELSTAAGRYQINKPTWLRLRARLSLYDFSPHSQDDCFVELLKERGAFDLVAAGKLEAACAKCNAEWASLPGGTSGQHENTFAQLQGAYINAGGTVA